MKLKKLFAGLLGLVAMVSCSKENVSPELLHDEPKIKKVRVDITAGQDPEGLRVAFGMTTDGSGATTGLELAEKDVLLRIAVRRGDTGKVLVQDIPFIKQRGRNYATYSGDIAVPTEGVGNYKIAAILLGEVEGESYFNVTKKAETPQFMERHELYVGYKHTNQLIQPVDGTLKINVPYVTKWQDITINSSNNTANRVTFLLEPQGTILRLRIKNETNVPQMFKYVKFVTNAMVNQGGYFIDETLNARPQWMATNTETISLYPATSISVSAKNGDDPSYSDWYYTWMMPRKLGLDSRITIASLSHVSSPTVFKPTFSTKKSLPLGSVPMTIIYNDGHDAVFVDPDEKDEEWGSDIAQPKLSLEYMAEYALDKTAKAFVSDYDTKNAAVGQFLPADAKAKLSTPILIAGKKYSLPTRNELVSILQPELDLTGIGGVKFANLTDVIEPNIKIGSSTRTYKADYKVVDGIRYAVRFKSGDNRNRTAFRYRVITEASESKHLLIEALYLGNELDGIDDISSPDYWTRRGSEIISRRMPLYGSYLPYQYPGELKGGNKQGYYLSSTQFDDVAHYVVVISETGSTARVSGSSDVRTYAVIPFIR